MPASRRARLGRNRNWLERHKQRLVYLLLAGSMAVAVGAATVGGFLLRRAANIERQALRTQQLAGAAVELQGFSLQARAGGVTKQLAAGRKQALETTSAAFEDVRAHDSAESDRIRAAYLAYVRGSTREFRQETESGRTSVARERQSARQLSRLESLIDIESRRLARAARVANPEARAAVASAAVAAALLVGLLIWQFRLERRAGRIDRDNTTRSEELIRLRDEFVAAVSHELRTPLTSIIGYLDLLKDNELGNLTPDQLAFIAAGQRGADRLHQLVGDLLLVAEGEHGMLTLAIHEIDLDALAAKCVEAARPDADAKQIQLSLSRGSTRPIQGDAPRLGQMLDTLLSNAIKFTPAGGRVGVRTAFHDGQALVEVTDSGPGIFHGDQAQLFDRFFRSRAATDKAIGGTGLGLTITKAIVDAHHGSITVESTVGKGSTFRVRLPETQEPTRPAPAP